MKRNNKFGIVGNPQPSGILIRYKNKIPNMHSCFSDIADKKRRKVNSFRNTNYGNQLSKVVKLIKKWVMDALKREKI